MSETNLAHANTEFQNRFEPISQLPYPVNYSYSDLSWYKNDDSNIFVYFNGWSDYHFQICCGKRQLHFFERFLEDYKTFKESENSRLEFICLDLSGAGCLFF